MVWWTTERNDNKWQVRGKTQMTATMKDNIVELYWDSWMLNKLPETYGTFKYCFFISCVFSTNANHQHSTCLVRTTERRTDPQLNQGSFHWISESDYLTQLTVKSRLLALKLHLWNVLKEGIYRINDDTEDISDGFVTQKRLSFLVKRRNKDFIWFN